jgi:hypothetical protein
LTSSIKQKTRRTILIIFVCAITALLLFTIFIGNEQTDEILGIRSFDAASQAAKIIDTENIIAIKTSRDSDSLDFIRLQEELAFYRKALNLKHLLILTRNSYGYFYYLGDVTDKAENEFSNLGNLDTNNNNYSIYNNVMAGNVEKNVVVMDRTLGRLVFAYVPLKDENGKVVAFLGAGMDATGIKAGIPYDVLIIIVCIVLVILTTMGAVWIFTNRITDPIIKLRDSSLMAMKGEDAERLLSGTKDEIGQLAAVFNSKINAIHNILDNTGEGLLTFGSSLKVNREYSYECLRIFNNERIENKKIIDLIYPDNEDERNFMEMNLNRIYKEKDKLRKKAYLSLLSPEVIVNGRNIKFIYKLISDVATGQDMIMVILRDITEKKILENNFINEKNTLDSVVKVMANSREFSNLVNNYYIFTSIEIRDLFESNKTTRDILYELYCKIHSFKGDFSIYGMQNIVKALHEFEQELSDLHSELQNPDVFRLKEFVDEHSLETWLDKDMKQLSQIIGSNVVNEIVGNGRVMVVEDFKLKEFEEYIKNTLEYKDRESVLLQFRRLGYKPLNSMMRLYPDYIQQLANRLNKEVDTLEIAGGDFMVEESKYKNFIESLIHIFRNSISHGIEDPDERVSNNKPEQGLITCAIDLKDKQLAMVISDNGRGIDVERIKWTAIDKKIRTREQLEKMTEDEIINMIFIEEFSTKESVTELSGRGIGLIAFKRELQKLNGTVVVKSQKGIGTSFIISIPEVEADCFSSKVAQAQA